MQRLFLPEPDRADLLEDGSEMALEWFDAPPFSPEGEPWFWLTPEHSKRTWRLFDKLRYLFDGEIGEWFAASCDRPEYIKEFRERAAKEVGATGTFVYVLHGPYTAVYTTVAGFLEAWPRLRTDKYFYYILPLDLSYWFEVNHIPTANVRRRANPD